MTSNKALHILNGTGMQDGFNKLNISGHSISWNEAFIEGALLNNIESVHFWVERKRYFERQGVIKFPASFHQQVITALKTSSVVYCWFEYDLFCQINMIGALALLVKNNYVGKIYLVQIGPSELKHYHTFGSSSVNQWMTCYNLAKQITVMDINFINKIWNLITSTDIHDLNKINSIPIPPNFHYLEEALALIKYLFPNYSSRLNRIESAYLTLINQENREGIPVMDLLLKKFHKYGFGDSQIEKIIADLRLPEKIEVNNLNELFFENIKRTKSFSNFNWDNYTYNEKLNTILISNY